MQKGRTLIVLTIGFDPCALRLLPASDNVRVLRFRFRLHRFRLDRRVQIHAVLARLDRLDHLRLRRTARHKVELRFRKQRLECATRVPHHLHIRDVLRREALRVARPTAGDIKFMQATGNKATF